MPRVAVASTWVSPRVKSAEPCVRAAAPGPARELANLGRLAIIDAAIVIDDRLAHDGALDFFECLDHFAVAAGEACV